MTAIKNKLVKNLQKFFIKNNFSKAVVGLSGGIDSAVTLKLGILALGKKNITAILMPEEGVSKEEHLKDARDLAINEGVEYFVVPIKSFLNNFAKMPWDHSSFADMNTRARVRMAILYHFSNSRNAIVLGTGNKSEIMLGYGTKYGDFGVDVEVIGDLYKTEVYKLAKELNLPEKFINKKPTAELFYGQTDEGEIGASYEVIDKILQRMGNKKKQTDEPEIVKKIIKMVKYNRHKSKPVPIIKKS